mgnify:CR=1 FL=1
MKKKLNNVSLKVIRLLNLIYASRHSLKAIKPTKGFIACKTNAVRRQASEKFLTRQAKRVGTFRLNITPEKVIRSDGFFIYVLNTHGFYCLDQL